MWEGFPSKTFSTHYAYPFFVSMERYEQHSTITTVSGGFRPQKE
jgi:hypothetical protein